MSRDERLAEHQAMKACEIARAAFENVLKPSQRAVQRPSISGSSSFACRSRQGFGSRPVNDTPAGVKNHCETAPGCLNASRRIIYCSRPAVRSESEPINAREENKLLGAHLECPGGERHCMRERYESQHGTRNGDRV